LPPDSDPSLPPGEPGQPEVVANLPSVESQEEVTMKRNEQCLKEDRFKCDTCNFMGRNTKDLKVHKKTSHKPLKFKCKLCDYEGTHFSSLKQHIKSKHGSEEFMCDSCNYTSCKKDNVTHHSLRKHEIKKKSGFKKKLIGLTKVVAGSRNNSSPVIFVDIGTLVNNAEILLKLLCICGGGGDTNSTNKTNRDTIVWYRDTLNNGQMSQENIKNETIKFFGNNIEINDKKTIYKKLLEFQQEHTNLKLKVQRKIQKSMNGQGKHCNNPPDSFTPNINELTGIIEHENGEYSCEKCGNAFNDMTAHMQLQTHSKEKKAAFTKLCRNEINIHTDYIGWLDRIVEIPGILETEEDAMKQKLYEVERQKENILNEKIDYGNETFKITSSESNIIDAERTILTENADGTVKKSVVKEQLARITVRKRKSSGDNTENIEPGPSGEGKRKKARTVNSVMNHLTENKSDEKAEMVAKLIDMNETESPDFANIVMKKSKVLQDNLSLNAEQTTSLIAGSRASDLVFTQMRTAFNSTIGYSPIASRKQVEKHREEIMVVKKEDWKIEMKNIYQNKQGKNKHIPKETPVWSVKDLLKYITKLAESEDLDLTNKTLPVCFDGDAGAGRFVATFAFLNRHDKDVKLHPFLLFEGSDTRKNMELTFGEFTETFAKLEGTTVTVNNEEVTINTFGLFDLCALNCLIGKQNHSATFPCGWTNVSRDHLQPGNHANKPHTPANCKDIQFLSMQDDYEANIAHNAVSCGDKNTSKSGKSFGSVVANNLIPFIDIYRYIPPLMHIIMGLTNDALKELKSQVIKFDNASKETENAFDGHHEQVQEKLKEMYDEVEDLEAQFSNINLAIMVVLNDMKRVKLLKDNKVKEASEVAKENYNYTQRRKNKKKPKCDADLCLIFDCDVVNDWDEKFICKNTCEIHVRCEGVALVEDGQQMPPDYLCKKCKNGVSNIEWIEETLNDENKKHKQKQHELSVRITSVKAEIDHHEYMEETFSGPKQRLLKEAMKSLGDIARYHGGDLQGKQVQKLLDDFRPDENNEKKKALLECIANEPETHAKFVRAFTTLANASDAFKLEIDPFDEEDLKQIKSVCEDWGKHWTVDFPNRSITPKGHILTFVLPRIAIERGNFYRFYKIEQKGESIHADMNDIDRKVWCVRKKEARLWKLIERYELRNVTNVEIVVPIKRMFKTVRHRNARYI
jgi:hypothetical protein